MNISKQEIEKIVSQVLSQTLPEAGSLPLSTVSTSGDAGLFDRIEDAIDAAHSTFRQLKDYSLNDRQRYINEIKSFTQKENTF